jgi:hypothetical protein
VPGASVSVQLVAVAAGDATMTASDARLAAANAMSVRRMFSPLLGV